MINVILANTNGGGDQGSGKSTITAMCKYTATSHPSKNSIFDSQIGTVLLKTLTHLWYSLLERFFSYVKYFDI